MMSIRARLMLILAFATFVAYPLWWAKTQSPQARIEQARAAARGPCPRPEDVKRLAVVDVKVSVSKYPENWRHIVDARAGRNTGPDGTTIVVNGLRWPTVLTLNRSGADERRAAAFRLGGLPTRPGKARDEWPPAFGRSTNAADLRYVDRRANSGQGASMGNQLRNRCDGQRFRPVAAP